MISPSKIEGNAAEQSFIKAAERNGWQLVRKAKRLEDMHQHWDFLFLDEFNEEVKIDIKAHKHTRRNGPLLKDWFWIEWANVRGNDGWLCGSSDYIAFEYYNNWYIYDTPELKRKCETLVDFGSIASSAADSEYKIYTRKNRKDQTSKVRISDLEEIVVYNWPKLF